jgi:hypothetical protein
LANLLFDVVKYLLTVIGVGAVVPGSHVSFETASMGFVMEVTILAFALIATPEE